MSKIEIHQTGITALHTDAIVNAANSHLVQGGGVCGAIFKAAGEEQLAAACQAIGNCAVGCAEITPAFKLQKTNGIKFIIHAVGPDYRKSLEDPDNRLYSCYGSALGLAMLNGLHSVGFPLISAGIYSCPTDKAWRIALSACSDFIQKHPGYDMDIVFASRDESIAAQGKQILQSIQDKSADALQSIQDKSAAVLQSVQKSDPIPASAPEDYSELPDEIAEMLSKVDRSEYPETYAMLESAAELLDEEDEEEVFNFMSELSSCDVTLPLQENVADLMRAVLGCMADSGNGDAALLLGSHYYTGRIGEQSFATALKYYHIAADLGNEQATENLGYCYYYGRSIPVDYEKAYHCFIKGALTGMLTSLYKIGDMYRNGYYVQKDEKEAFRIYENCGRSITDDNVRQCGADVSMRMGDCYFEGIGCKKNLQQALHYYQQAERMYYDRLNSGDYLFKNSLKHVLLAEQQCRIQIMADLPDFEWTKEQ